MIETTDIRQPEPSMDEPSRVPPFFTALFTRRTWTELLYALLGPPLGVLGFGYNVVTLALALG
jgi:hypothetical protein